MAPTWWRRELVVGDRGPDVATAQRLLGLEADGVFTDATAVVVRGLQVAVGLPAHGAIDEATASALGHSVVEDALPDWWDGAPIPPGDGRYETATGGRDEAWVRRFQGDHGHPPTGILTETIARMIHAGGWSASKE
jgi:peptidoglycan hydrolase-like protein with peptidoglycan-binding domain